MDLDPTTCDVVLASALRREDPWGEEKRTSTWLKTLLLLSNIKFGAQAVGAVASAEFFDSQGTSAAKCATT